jgi:membrane peptidoglycan carboxypeptidase
VANAEGAGHGTYSLYTATTQSINVFYAKLEKRIGLCNVVKTAVSMGDHRADGGSLLRPAGKPGTPGYQPPADEVPSFTLGSVDVSPMTMAAAYASVAAGGVYCRPVAIARITATGTTPGQVRQLPAASAGCHRVFSPAVAAAATHILRGVLTSGTAKGDGVTRHGASVPQAGKTGTANSFDFAAFGGYTPKLAGFVSEFNPSGPVSHPMVGNASCYRVSGGGKNCPGSVLGANAGQIWQLTFEHADLGRTFGSFLPVPRSSAFFRAGTGQPAPATAKHR